MKKKLSMIVFFSVTGSLFFYAFISESYKHNTPLDSLKKLAGSKGLAIGFIYENKSDEALANQYKIIIESLNDSLPVVVLDHKYVKDIMINKNLTAPAYIIINEKGSLAFAEEGLIEPRKINLVLQKLNLY